ncbi:sporulation inhibitor of replication protein SirA [Halalkalibacter urbisdiaboli]|uniref:sporulation inhibitor of replication protein SirA n=1 Tax=Halalkalibacter urbisdiaboli TaxID=1960589 RepID=UPI000B430EAE|nr:sporulation inhibitor of replication protein SirA [Halalkalibacter urbisdiaboli]
MRHYDLYLLEEEIARHYFGQESKLFHLFLERSKATIEQRLIIDKQVAYISKPLPSLLLQQKLKHALKFVANYQMKKQTHYVELHHPESCAELIIYENKLSLTSEGSLEAETLFFEVLRKIDPCFFAVNLEGYRFGWLNPIKQVKLL